MFSFYKLVESLEQIEEFMGRQPEGRAKGPGGNCVCPMCNIEVPHELGKACNKMPCPKCGKLMSRKEEPIEEFYLDPSLRPSIKRLAKSGTEIKDPVTKKNFFKTIKVLALQRQKAQKATKTEG